MIITIIILIIIISFTIMIFHVSKIVHSNVTNVIIKKYVFRKHRFIITLMMFVLIEQNYELCFDTGCIINFIDKKNLFKIFSDIVVKKISIFMIIKDIDVNIYNVNEYIKL